MTRKINAFVNNICSKIQRNNANIATKIETANNAHKKITAQYVIQPKDG